MVPSVQELPLSLAGSLPKSCSNSIPATLTDTSHPHGDASYFNHSDSSLQQNSYRVKYHSPSSPTLLQTPAQQQSQQQQQQEAYFRLAFNPDIALESDSADTGEVSRKSSTGSMVTATG